MLLDTRIKSNKELYKDIELIPLPLDAVQQRIDYFKAKTKETIDTDQFEFFKYYKALEFWEQVKENHCIKEK